MTQHDMGGFYRLVGERLTQEGHGEVAYSLAVEWWNHRHATDPTDPGDPQRVRCTIYVAYGAERGGNKHYEGATFDEAFGELTGDLGNHPVSVRPTMAPPVSDVTVLTC